ncbi:MAG: hypothetical protein H0T78_02645 [Longispora sp.]|nr:hypothetical protein [Longispora sp. (in: high G+C Gram-positive bacteria)]
MSGHEYDDLPLAEADRRLKEDAKEAQQRLKLERGRRLQKELDAGRPPYELAAEIQASSQVVYSLTRQWRISVGRDNDN